MKVYSPAETAVLLGIKTATLRKYSLLLEKNGYEISRNSKRHRYYQDKDVMTIRNVITASNNGATLEEAVKNVVNLKGHSNESNETDNAQTPNNSDMQELKEMMKKQSETMNNYSKLLLKQNELILHLTDRLDDQEQYISEQIDIKLNEPGEQIKEIEAPKEDEPVKNNQIKKGFFAKLFNK